MDILSSNAFDKFDVPASFYDPETDLHEYINRSSPLQRVLCDNEFDCYSDFSIDTSSSFENAKYLNWAMQGKNDPYLRTDTLTESLMQYGRGSPLWSDDEMNELLQFDHSVRLCANELHEEEERRYLAEWLRQDIVNTELGFGYPERMEDAHLNYERTPQDVSGDFFPIPISLWNSIQDGQRPNTDDILNKEGLQNLYRHNIPIKSKCNTNRILPNPNGRKNRSEKHPQTHMYIKKRSIQTIKAAKEGSPKLGLKKKSNKMTTNEDKQRVFLGGLPIGITERNLRQHLAAQGYKVLKRPKILHGFAPEVWMKTVEQAKDLIERGVIIIDGHEVEVRPYNSLTKLSKLKKLPNVGKRSVFIGGLSAGTTTKNLLDVLSEMGLKVINYPVVKHGFARQVILETISQAKTIVKMRHIRVNGEFADVRPFVNQKPKRTKKIRNC